MLVNVAEAVPMAYILAVLELVCVLTRMLLRTSIVGFDPPMARASEG